MDLKEYHAHTPGCPARVSREFACRCGARVEKKTEDAAALALRRALGSMKL